MTTVSRTRFNSGKDLCLGFFREFWDEGAIEIPQGGRVLEIGCAEADWLTPMKATRPDLHLTGTDQRDHPARPGADLLVRGNVMDQTLFPQWTFDAIIAVSVLEHVGVGRYGDPVDECGDIRAMANLRHWLKPNGVLYFDVPWRPWGPSTPFRQYNETDLQNRLLLGWRIERRREFYPDHPDGPYVAVVVRP